MISQPKSAPSSAAVPATTAAAPGITAAVPGISAAVPGTTAAAPGITAAVPGISAAVPGTTAAAPGITAAVPGTTAAVPGIIVAAPGTTVAVPGISAAVPGITAAAAAVLLALTGCRSPSSGPVFKSMMPAPAESAAGSGADAPKSKSGAGAGAALNAVAPGMTRPGPAAALDPALLKPPTDPYRVGPGDVLEIELIGGPDGPQSTFVGPDGKIYFNLLPGLQVWGYTLEETRVALEHGLSQFLQNPRISLTLREVRSRRVQVVGRVNTPGLYELGQPMTVLDAISQARGLATSRMSGASEEMADLHHSFLLRGGKVIPVNFERLIRQGDTSQNVYLQADDLLFLPSTMGSQIFVLGGVNQPRSVPFKGRPTLITALAACRGLTADAKPKHIAIVRGSLQNPSVAVVDATEILKGRKPDILLSAHDIVYVPLRSPSSLRSYLELVVSAFARSLAASTASAVTGSDQPVGLSVGQ